MQPTEPQTEPTDTLSKRRHANAKLSFVQIANILKLLTEGRSQREIGKLYGVDQSTISDINRTFADSREVAKKKLYAAAEQIAGHAVMASEKASKRGDGSVALELLDRTDTLSKKRDTQGRGGVTVVVGCMPGQAAPEWAMPKLPELAVSVAPIEEGS